MASDLSKLIPENLSTTLSTLLAQETKLVECTKVDKRDFEENELLKVDVEFVFDKLTTIFSYYIPSKSASTIFNIMMGSPDGEILLKIDDDTADAMAEFISNTCGGLVTTINGSEFEDLGKSKFNIKHKEILDSNSIESVENMYRFLVDVDGEQTTIFTKFEENFSMFITELTNAQPTFYPEAVVEEIEEKLVNKESQEEPIKNSQEVDKVSPEEVKEDKEEDPKAKKLKKIIIIVSALIGITFISGIVMYILGVFDPEPVKITKENNATEKSQNKSNVVQYNTVKKVDFKMSDINVKRLNNKLELLTKYQVLTQEELEKQAQDEKQRIIQLKKEQALMEFAKKNKEEPLILKEKIKKEKKSSQSKSQKTPQTSVPKKTPTIKPNDTLQFVLANSLKYKLFKRLVIQSHSTTARISICNANNGKTQIFIGPFESKKLQIKLNTLIQESDQNVETTLIHITQKEFNTKCNF